VLLIKQYERNLKQLNFIVNQINVIIYSYQHSMKKYLPRFFKFYQPKTTGGGFLIFEWTLIYGDRTIISFVGFVANLLNRPTDGATARKSASEKELLFVHL
jgi:hypothetical protein